MRRHCLWPDSPPRRVPRGKLRLAQHLGGSSRGGAWLPVAKAILALTHHLCHLPCREIARKCTLVGLSRLSSPQRQPACAGAAPDEAQSIQRFGSADGSRLAL